MKEREGSGVAIYVLTSLEKREKKKSGDRDRWPTKFSPWKRCAKVSSFWGWGQLNWPQNPLSGKKIILTYGEGSSLFTNLEKT